MLCIGMMILSFAGAAYAQTTEVPAPQFTVGESWQYQGLFESHTTTVVGITPDGGTIRTRSTEPDARLIYDNNMALVAIQGTTKKQLTPGYKFIEFPVSIGKAFTYKVTTAVGARITINVTATKFETVKVAAGSFEAVVLESCWANPDRNWSDCGMRHWYAPAVKAFVKRTTPIGWAEGLRNGDFELVKYTPAP